MIEPSGAQRLKSFPAVADADGDTEDIAEFTIEVAQVALRMVDDADRQIRQTGQALGKQTHDDTLAGTGLAVDQGEAPSSFRGACSMRQQKFSTLGGT
jgi:hypothetical protein